ncbi:hypothetical protein FOXYSP1_16922 [Fusarium oxysporum f. sp. phaseoli]
MTASFEALTCCDLVDLNSNLICSTGALQNIDQRRGVSDVVAAVRGWRFIFPVAHAAIPRRRLPNRELIICGGHSPLFGIALCIFHGPPEQLDIV